MLSTLIVTHPLYNVMQVDVWSLGIIMLELFMVRYWMLNMVDDNAMNNFIELSMIIILLSLHCTCTGDTYLSRLVLTKCHWHTVQEDYTPHTKLSA